MQPNVKLNRYAVRHEMEQIRCHLKQSAKARTNQGSNLTWVGWLIVPGLLLAGWHAHNREGWNMRRELLSLANEDKRECVARILRKMSRQELTDSYTLLTAARAGQMVTDTELIKRLSSIAGKYKHCIDQS